MRPLTGWRLLVRSHGARAYLLAAAALTLVGCALGPDSRSVITRDGAIGEPLPFVLALVGTVAMVCLEEPAPDLINILPRPRWHARAVRAGFVMLGGAGTVATAHLVAPGLSAATCRNLLLALTVTFLVALWRPLLAWIPTGGYLTVSWFRGTAAADDAAQSWAVPAQPPSWPIAGLWAVTTALAAVLWVLHQPNLVGQRGHPIR